MNNACKKKKKKSKPRGDSRGDSRIKKELVD
jgi:hypothetical protein